MKRNSKIAIVCIIVAAVGAFGYFQFVSATHLHVSILESKVVQKTNDSTLYDMKLQFNNPSLLVLNLGQTDFVVTIDGQNLGTGTLQPSVIPSMGNTVSKTPFLADNSLITKYDKSDNIPNVKLTGTSKYDLLFASVSIPFTYYPTQEEAREFIHGT
ncbi:MAG: hypothetical protein ABI340_07800 [Nitrososphaera sp.]|jgi:hypothetical protein